MGRAIFSVDMWAINGCWHSRLQCEAINFSRAVPVFVARAVSNHTQMMHSVYVVGKTFVPLLKQPSLANGKR